jgi:hypothetical protein
VEWIRSLVQQCRAAGVPAFVKQLGSNVLAGNPCDPIDQFPNDAIPRFSQGPDVHTAAIHLRDRKGGDPAEWPEDLRVREFPAVPQTAHGQESVGSLPPFFDDSGYASSDA